MSERDTGKKLPVIDGPSKGQRIAHHDEQFSFEVNSATSRTKAQVTYCLRRHRVMGLVWATPGNKSVSAP